MTTLVVPSATAASVDPVVVPGNPTCQGLGYDFEFKVDPPNSGTYPVPGVGSVTITTADGVSFDWTSTFGIDAVLVKGGPNANLYIYDPPAESFGDTGLHSPINPANGQPFGLSHISFCYDLELVVTKTAETSFERKYHWTIDKIGDQTELTLMPGQTFFVNYDVTVDLDDPPFTDSNWAVSGEIQVFNPAPAAAEIASVTDVVSPGIVADVDCPVTFPHTLAAGATLTCTYSADLPDASQRVNTATATVTVNSVVDGDSGTADVIFGDPTTVLDECIDVEDSKAGPLGTVCVEDAPKTFEYTLQVGPYEECGEFTFTNVATGTTQDCKKVIEDDHDVVVTVPCEQGCTLTPGYWKTHSEYGPAPYDDAWLALGPLGQDTPFFLSGQTYYEVLWTAPGGNAYYILAHAYIAAELNILNGADGSAVATQMAQAKALFEANTPAQAGALKGAARNVWINLATTLDNYNNGLIGPGHCSE